MTLEHELKAQKAGHDKKISSQEAENGLLEKSNQGTRANIKRLQILNSEKRGLVAKISQELNGQLGAAEGLQSNLTAASAALDGSGSNFTQLLDASVPQLAVLGELDAEAARNREQKEHAQGLKAVVTEPAAPSALLQTSSERIVPEQAAKLLQKLSASLENIEKEYNASSARFEREFQAKFAAGAARTQALLAEQSELRAQEAKQANISAKLDETVKHLQQTRDLVRMRNKGLRQYVRKIAGEAPAPAAAQALARRLTAKRRHGHGAMPAHGRSHGAKAARRHAKKIKKQT